MPRLYAWDIGHNFSNVCAPWTARLASREHSTQPAGAADVAQWARRLTDALYESSSLPVTAGTHDADVTSERNIRLASLCAPFAFASMQGHSVENVFARSWLDPEVVPFLAMLAAAFSYKPVVPTGFGNPTCPQKKFSGVRDLPLSARARERRVLYGRARTAARRRPARRVLVVLG